MQTVGRGGLLVVGLGTGVERRLRGEGVCGWRRLRCKDRTRLLLWLLD